MKCQYCGIERNTLVAHRESPLKSSPSYITVCYTCHSTIHKATRKSLMGKSLVQPKPKPREWRIA